LRTAQPLQRFLNQRFQRHAAELAERNRVSLAAMPALAADQRDFKLTEVVRKLRDRARHGAHFEIGGGEPCIQ
jgi:hypothetical protein